MAKARHLAYKALQALEVSLVLMTFLSPKLARQETGNGVALLHAKRLHAMYKET